MFFDIRKDLTYNAFITIEMGGRGIGKTYSTQDFVLSRYFKTGERFIHIRRTDSELDVAAEPYFNKIVVDKYPDKDITYKSGFYLHGEEVCGYAIPLSLSNKYKSVPFDSVRTIIFEEFLSDGTYLPNEPFKLLEFLETCIRLRDDVRVIMLSNSMSRANPYFLTWDLPYPKIGERIRKGQFLIHRIATDEDYVITKNETRLGKLANDVGYADYIIGNEYALDEPSRIEKPEQSCKYFCTIVCGDRTFGVVINYSNYHTIITAKGDSSYPFKIILKPGLARRAIKQGRGRSIFITRITNGLLNDELYYDSEKTQTVFKGYIPYFL